MRQWESEQESVFSRAGVSWEVLEASRIVFARPLVLMPLRVGFRGLGFGVWGLGFGVWGFVLRVEGLGFGVWGLRFEV